MGEDLLWPGYAYEIWSGDWRGSGGDTEIVNGAPYTGSDLTFEWGSAAGPDVDVLVGTATTTDADWEIRAEAPWDADVVWVTITITARAAMSAIRIGRVFDADTDWGWDGSWDTWNEVGDGWAAAAGERDGRTLALASPGADARICDFCSDVAGILAGTTSPSQDDAQLGLVVDVPDLAPGESASVRFAYAFAMDLDTAVALAVDAAANADHDADGVDAGDDCDDADASVYPGAVETSDGRDEDCDGAIDEESADVDDDGDGFAETDGDCDDADAAAYPGGSPAVGVTDADCDGVADNGDDLPAGDTGEDKVEIEGGCDTGGAGPEAALAGLALLATFGRRSRK
jgi:uncharacterized protein (TIGR03382 family)